MATFTGTDGTDTVLGTLDTMSSCCWAAMTSAMAAPAMTASAAGPATT